MKGKKTGGRTKGIRNKATQKLRDEVVATGLTPEYVMIDNMRHAYRQALEIEANIGLDTIKGTDDPAEQFERLMIEVKRAVGYRQVAQECAKDAAPYCHPRLASTEAAVSVDGKLIVEIVQFASDQNTKQLDAPSLSSEGLGLSGKGPGAGRPASMLSLASPQRKG